MKNLLFVCALFLVGNAFAQNTSVFTVQPNPASGSGTINDSDVPVDGTVSNVTSNTIHLKWERRVISLTPGCETAVCDPNTCWARFVSTKNFDMDPNTTGELLVHFYNMGAPCAGIIHLKVTNRDNTADTLIAVYLFNQNITGAQQPILPTVEVFPNPVQNYFELQNAAEVGLIRLFNLDGREVATFEPAADNRYSIETLPAGNYVLALENKEGQAFQAVPLLKQ